MYNFPVHRVSGMKRLSLIALFCCSALLAAAQDEVTADTAYQIDAPYSDEEAEQTYHFDQLEFGDTPHYQPHRMPDSVVDRLLEDEAFWYVNKSPARKKIKEPQVQEPGKLPFYLKDWFRTLLWTIIIAAFVAVLVWFLIASDVRLFRKKPAIVQSGSDDELPDDIFAIDYEKELARANTSKNYHLAVRLMYLHVLKVMADREIINYRAGKTNSDYLFELYNSAYYKDFFRITRSFEYVWYGQFALAEPAYNRIQQDYETLKSRLQ